MSPGVILLDILLHSPNLKCLICSHGTDWWGHMTTVISRIHFGFPFSPTAKIQALQSIHCSLKIPFTVNHWHSDWRHVCNRKCSFYKSRMLWMLIKWTNKKLPYLRGHDCVCQTCPFLGCCTFIKPPCSQTFSTYLHFHTVLAQRSSDFTML